ncbi:MAG TPA: protein kinase [Gemmatimonadaceae bacterium]|nr:protein kinase [Gemmatimonadaceae bacterium]
MRRLADTYPPTQIVAVNGSISDINRSADALWTAVIRLVGADYELAGELGASIDGRRTAYVATCRTPGQELVLLVVERGADPDAYELSVHEMLDENVPARDLYCRQCAFRLETWSAVCNGCGRSTALTTAIPRGQASDLSIRSAIISALGADSTLLGQLPTAAGGVAVFARSGRTGEVVVLTLERIGGATGPTRAVPIVRLQRHDTVDVAGAPPEPTLPPTQKRPSSPHSGEIGPLPERDRSLVDPPPSEPPRVLVLVCPSCRSRYEAGERFCPVDGSELLPMSEQEDLVGRLLGGKFRVEKLLGQGGMGRVYLAEHVRIGRRCALKVLAPNLVGDPNSIRRFDGEARNASRIVHPSVAVVYDFEETPDGLVYLVLEYVDGETLGTILGRSENQRIDVDRAMRIARDVADALQAAHDLGIVHRDLKPDNIMITRIDRVKVVDFGIAKAVEDGGGAAAHVTRTGFVVGTPRYMSPEQLAGADVDARTDIYALGGVLYEMVTGRAAYDAPVTAERTLRQPKFREDAPRALDAIIMTAMARTPDGRFQTAAEMRDALDALLSRGRAASRRALFTKIAIGVIALAGVVAAAFAIVNRLRVPAAAVSAPAVASVTPAPVGSAAATPIPVPSAPTTPATGTKPVVPVPIKSPPVQPSLKPSAPQDTISEYLGRPVQYLVHMRRVIHGEWVQALDGHNPAGPERAEYAIGLDQKGRVTKVTPVLLAGQAAYDTPIQTALHRIVTFGAPPPRVGHEVHVEFHGFGMTVKAGSLETPAGPVRQANP